MDGYSATTTRRLRQSLRWAMRAVLLAGAIGVVPSRGFCANEFVEDFETERVSWKVRTIAGTVDHVSQWRMPSAGFGGTGAEAFSFRVTRGRATVQFEHAVPTAKAISELSLELMVRSTTTGLAGGLRVVFPRQTDPRNGQQLKAVFKDGTYSQAPDWQKLIVRVSDDALRDQIRLLRAQLRPTTLDLRDPVVDRVILELALENGQSDVVFDALKFGPIVSTSGSTKVQPVQATDDAPEWPVKFQLDRLLIDGRPFLPRMMAYHGEPLERLRESGFNVIWIPDAADVALQRSLREQGLWAVATPPRVKSKSGNPLDPEFAGLPPTPVEWSNILAWNLGVALSSESRSGILPWIAQVQSADRDIHRPIMADVVGGERIYSRHIAMLGSSRHILNSSLSFKDYRDSLDQHRKLARPGSFLFTWLPTEPMPDVARQRLAAGRIPMIVEPEQLWLSAYAAIAAGCRGIGYSLGEPLDSPTPGADERRLAIAQLNLQLELLEEFLAGGTLIEQRPFEITAPPGPVLGLHNVAFRNSAISRAENEARLAATKSAGRRESRLHSELEAAVFRHDKAVLLLPIWYEQDAQFVPGQLAAGGATIDVSSVPDTASAWEVTTTRIANLASEPIPGGRRIKLPHFDTTAAIVVASDPQVVANLRTKMESMQARSARLWIDLAKAKLNRVRIADDELTKQGVGQPDAPQLLGKARELIQRAEKRFPGEALERAVSQARESGRKSAAHAPDVVLLKRDFDEVARLSQASLQAMRILQKAHWETATHRLAAPISSPHTLCFQTLPDHWRLIANLGKSASRASENLLPSGDFEVVDLPTLARSGWQQVPCPVPPGLRAHASVQVANGRDGRCLRLVAAADTNADPPNVVESPTVAVVSPSISVNAGQILHISGWVRVSSAISGSADGITITDNLTGRAGAWRAREKREWQRLELLREVYQDSAYSLTFTLHGLGDVQFDDFQIIVHDWPQSSPLAAQTGNPNDSAVRPGRFDFLQRWPRFPQRKEPEKPSGR